MTRTTLPHITTSLLAVLLLLSGFGCSNQMNPDVERGTNYVFRDGFPEVRMTALGTVTDDNEPAIHVTSDIVYGSLVYKSKSKDYSAQISIYLQILKKEGDNYSSIRNESYTLDVNKSDRSIVNSEDVITFEKEYQQEPGEYKVNVTVKDQSSGKESIRSSTAIIPNPRSDNPIVTSVQLFGKYGRDKNNEYIPVTTYDVPGKIDSLRFLFQINKGVEQDTVKLQTKLVKFRADTAPARSMSFNTPSPSSIAHKGIEYDETTEIQRNTRQISTNGTITIEQHIPNLERGNYRFEANIDKEYNDEEIYKAREFGVKSKNYPAVKTPKELARPLYYLMGTSEYKKILKINDKDSLKHAIDQFWLSNIKDKSTAKTVISRYYKRVEEANKQFSNFKEGWKTDPGMIYILFGPPWYVNRSLDRMQWSYSYDRQNSRYNFYFELSRMTNKYYPFENYILQRSNHYYSIEYQQRQLWLTGQILNRNI